MPKDREKQGESAAAIGGVAVQSLRGGRPGTVANVMILVLAGMIGTMAVHYGVIPFKDTRAAYLYGIIRDRGPVQYLELLMAWMVAAMIVLKARIIRKQFGVVASNPIPVDIDLGDDQQLQNLRGHLVQREDFGWSILLNRVDRAIALWLASKDVGRVTTYLAAESDRDTSSSDSSYALSRVLIWAIPILGFIGTVQGLGMAVAGFDLGGSADIATIKGAISLVTRGLSVAFDTTLLALVITTLLMFPLTELQRREEGLFVELDNYIADTFLGRLPASERQPIVIENLEDSIEAAFRRYIPDPDRYDEVFTRSIEKAATAVEERFGNLTRNYEATLRDLTDTLSSHLSGVGDAIQEALQSSMVEIRKQDAANLERRRALGLEEAARFQQALENVHRKAGEITEQYRQSAASFQEATSASVNQAVGAARDLASRVGEIAGLATGIQDLLKIEQAVEKTLADISASDDFRKTLQDLRRHLEVTSSFCERLSRPRVITLREERS
jgi:hypothetical protein